MRRLPLVVLLVAVAYASGGTALAPTQTTPSALVLVGSWGSAGSGDGQFRDARSLAIAANGDVYVADGDNERIQQFRADGTFVRKWGTPGAGPGQFSGSAPTGLAVGPDGSVYAADRNNHRIERFSADGAFLSQWGGPGTTPGRFNAPHGIATDRAGNVFVLEFFGQRLQKFTAAGAFVAEWGRPGSATGEFLVPVDVATDAAGNVYVADRNNDRIQKFTNDGRFVTAWGTPGGAAGQFSAPVGVAVSPSGEVWVADNNNFRLQRFTADGTFVAQYRTGAGGERFRPNDVAIAPSGDVYVADVDNRVLRFRLQGGPLPPPQQGRTVNVSVKSGTVLVRPRGARAFTRLTSPRQIPTGSELDTTRGRVTLTTAATAGTTQKSWFYEGRFVVTQPLTRGAPAELRLTGPLACGKTRAYARKPPPRKRRLWGDGKGRFRTRGRFATATVRGTKWLTEDRCGSTVVRVREGVVEVRDLVRGKRILVRAGRSYVARR